MALITTDDLAELTPFFGNGAEKTKKAEISIDNAQRQLLPILCEDTYQELVELEETGYLSAHWQVLYNLVRPWLAWEAFASYLPFSQHTDTDAGLRTFIDENSNSTTDAQLKGTISKSEVFADSYKSEIVSYMNKNADLFPDYKSSDCYVCKKENAVKRGLYGSGHKKRNTIKHIRLT